jgi:hypothetical protein
LLVLAVVYSSLSSQKLELGELLGGLFECVTNYLALPIHQHLVFFREHSRQCLFHLYRLIYTSWLSVLKFPVSSHRTRAPLIRRHLAHLWLTGQTAVATSTNFSNPRASYLILPCVVTLVRSCPPKAAESMRLISRCICIAGAPAVFNETCSGDCYQTWVLGPASNYDNAYFEVSYVRIFSTQGKSTVVEASSAQALSGTMRLWALVGAMAAMIGSVF